MKETDRRSSIIDNYRLRVISSERQVLRTADGSYRSGKIIPIKDTVDRALVNTPSIEHVIVLQRAWNDVTVKPGRDHWWHELIPGQPDEAGLGQTSAENLLMLIYTSGTSGKPRGTVHTHCCLPIKSTQDMTFGTDVHPGDVVCWMTDIGWMMGPWLVFGATILGRSDDTIKVAGKRLGPSEIESVLVEHPAVSESAAIGIPHDIKGNELVCFCVLTSGHEPDEELEGELKELIALEMGKPLKPRAVKFVSNLPRTRNDKIMRRIIKSAYLGRDPGDTSSLVNPESLEEIRSSGG